ncbi:mediator complex subunit MED4 [Cardiosporidium cionae]|uniref:Mediator complex subunit MED4 n=1 Tax=Cardiosporidium cionae TaxID=476202 RepID=A0ABQ7JC32_9APIC|nr:mediator complex subunit MED4 [Cardiosporidium cionae]|eukprot:KAF8821531.1 mediator complex subunit MED4 [Cardiosporidium cionae]
MANIVDSEDSNGATIQIACQLRRFLSDYCGKYKPAGNVLLEESNDGAYSSKQINFVLESLAPKDQFSFLLLTKNKIESPLLLLRKQLRFIRPQKDTHKLSLMAISDYSRRIAGCVAAPPETRNVSDPLLHQSIYPNYHFLNIVSHEEVLRSRLWDISRWGAVCFPPMIHFNRAGNAASSYFALKLTCSTPGVTLIFRIDDGTEKVFDNSKPFLLNGLNDVRVSAYARKNGYRNSRLTRRIAQFDPRESYQTCPFAK